MRTRSAISFPILTGLLAACLAGRARADVVDISFQGSGVSGQLQLTFGPATDAKYPGQGYEVTGISGTFSDTNPGVNIVGATVDSLVAITRDMPETGNDAAPHDFSRFAVPKGLPAESHGFVTFDNLFWPNGSPQTATSYPAQGGFLDIYGLFFSIGNGRFVDLWSNGTFAPNGPIDYGVAVVTSATALDYVGGSVTAVPEPSTLALLGLGLAGAYARRRRPS